MSKSEKPILIPRRFASLGDPIIVLVVFAIIYAVVGTATQWNSAYHAVTEIDLSPSALPLYTLLSAVRGLFALFISFVFAIAVGYLAAKSKAAEFIIIPMCDILQSIPVLGFLPGLVLALLTLFPNTNMGLELAAILMIFINQVWNLVFAFYSSLKSIPTDFNDASLLMNLTK